MPPVLALDIGGANLKAALSTGPCLSRPFALWRQPAKLSDAVADVLQALIPARFTDYIIAVTMTGELCDCFSTKREGVAHILTCVEAAANGRPVLVWRTDGSLVDLATARRESPLLVAAANWLALATWAGLLAPRGLALLLDIGSTTTDIIPIKDGAPIPVGRTDPERLRSGELLYTGVRRTPLCAVFGFGGAAEFFATTHDVYLVLGWLPEDPTDTDTADGRPATKACAHARLARMMCADLETSTEDERIKLVQHVLLKQVYHIGFGIERAIKRLGGPPQSVIVAGAGERLAQVSITEKFGNRPPDCVSVAARFGPQVSAAACAHALAVLARERS